MMQLVKNNLRRIRYYFCNFVSVCLFIYSQNLRLRNGDMCHPPVTQVIPYWAGHTQINIFWVFRNWIWIVLPQDQSMHSGIYPLDYRWDWHIYASLSLVELNYIHFIVLGFLRQSMCKPLSITRIRAGISSIGLLGTSCSEICIGKSRSLYIEITSNTCLWNK